MFVPLSWAYPDATSGASCMHVLPKGFHRIRHYGLLANGNRAANIATARALLARPACRRPATAARWHAGRAACAAMSVPALWRRMIIIEIFARGCEPRWRPTPSTIDTS